MVKRLSEVKYVAVLVELTVLPLGTGTPSVSDYIAAAVRKVQKCGVKYTITAMDTVIEAEKLEDAINAAIAAHEEVFKAGAKRVVTLIKIDDRRDVRATIEEKLRSVQEKL